MIHAHVLDAWTRDADRDRTAFHWATFIGGLAAPAFLFLAGLGSALSGASQQARGVPRADVMHALIRRGWYVFGLAFAFRVQALLLGWGAPIGLLKVDVLNVMGLALIVVGLLWGVSGTPTGRALVASLATVVIALGSPLLGIASWIDALPGPLQWYLRPTPGYTNFTLAPWTAFVTAGLAAGAALVATRDARREWRVHAALALCAVAVVAGGYWASFQPTIYAPGVSTFWGASPTFFAIRLGLVALFLPMCWALRRLMPASVGATLSTLGASSLFVYWVHVELVYGGIAIPIRHRLPLELSLACTVGLISAMARLVPWTRRWVARGPDRVLARRLVARLL
jgi:uncharacterized membrane protein